MIPMAKYVSPQGNAIISAVRTVQEQVVDHLRRLILQGEFAPGDKLQQEELAALLGVSAMPVREGLRRLQAEGLVEFVPRRGAFVATLSPEEFDELFQIREELEALGLRWAVERINPQEVGTLRELLRQIEAAENRHDVNRRAELIRSFLWTIFEAADRPHLLEAIRRYYNMTYLYQRQYSAVLTTAPRRMQIYRRMLAAMEAGDVNDAVAAHRANYHLIRETMLPLLKQRFTRE
jgi:DNA-binding GntR family transcriptional regulator